MKCVNCNLTLCMDYGLIYIQYSDELILILKSTDIEVQWKTRLGVICAQGCINCAIQLSGIGARGVSSEHMENMEMFSCSPT